MTEQSLTPSRDAEESIPFYPDHVRSEVKVVIAILGLVFIIGIIGLNLPVGLGDPADPLNTPTHVKPEWYFLAFYQILKYIPKSGGGILLMAIPLLIILWPFIDNKPDRSTRIVRIRLAAVVIGLILIVALTIWGEVS